MPADDLAQELIEAIVSGADDDASLKACALVARALVTPSQRLIFRRMEFSVDTAPRVMVRLRRAAGLLKTSPHLSVFVLDLDLYMTSDLSALEVILRRLRNVQRFAFRGDQRLLSTVAIRTAFMDFLSQPPLCTFICAVDGGDVAPGMVSAAFASCREVHISASTRVGPNGGADDGEMEFHADPWPEGKEERSTAVGRVEQLHIRFSSQDVNNFLRHPAIIKYLGRLRRAALWSMQAKVFHALAPSSSTLTHLMLPSLCTFQRQNGCTLLK
jgi:hypothetical protein